MNSHYKDLLVKYGRDTIGIHCHIHTKNINAMYGNIQSFLMLYELQVNVFVCVCVCVCVCVQSSLKNSAYLRSP